MWFLYNNTGNSIKLYLVYCGKFCLKPSGFEGAKYMNQ